MRSKGSTFAIKYVSRPYKIHAQNGEGESKR